MCRDYCHYHKSEISRTTRVQEQLTSHTLGLAYYRPNESFGQSLSIPTHKQPKICLHVYIIRNKQQGKYLKSIKDTEILGSKLILQILYLSFYGCSKLVVNFEEKVGHFIFYPSFSFQNSNVEGKLSWISSLLPHSRSLILEIHLF